MNKMNQGGPDFKEFLDGADILCHTAAETAEEVIGELAALLAEHHAGLDKNEITEAVLEREASFSTLLQKDLAMPHARMPRLAKPLVAVATSLRGVKFSGGTAKVVVLVLSPADQPTMHLQVMGALAWSFKDPEKLQELAKLTRHSDVMSFFELGSLILPDFLKVRDLMQTNVPTLLEQCTLHQAVRKFAATRAAMLPVLDDEGDLRGVLSLEDVLHYSLPEHILWMDDLSPIYNFEPFADLLKNADETRVADVMTEDFVAVDEDVPAVQLAKLFLTTRKREIVVLDPAGKLAGTVEMGEFCARLFWE